MTKSLSPKVGRPKNGETTVRISPRFPEGVAEIVRKASALRGVTVSSFVFESARRAAEQVIDEETRWRLDADATSRLAALLARPPKVNAAAKRAEVLAADVAIRP